MVYRILKINQSFETQNLSKTNFVAVANPPLRTFSTQGKADSFLYSNPKINPATQNPIYNINDEILASVFPQALVSKYTNKNFLLSAANINPNIKNLLNIAGAPLGVYPENIFTNTNSHFVPALKTACDIMDKCNNGDDKFTKRDYATMTQAALLHDVGKAYIPSAILNKKGALSEHERKIVDTHAKAGYEALKSGGVSGVVLHLIKNHHNYGIQNPPMVQILRVADIYSALKEERPYKREFSDSEALEILYERAQKGDFDKKYVDALKDTLN